MEIERVKQYWSKRKSIFIFIIGLLLGAALGKQLVPYALLLTLTYLLYLQYKKENLFK